MRYGVLILGAAACCAAAAPSLVPSDGAPEVNDWQIREMGRYQDGRPENGYVESVNATFGDAIGRRLLPENSSGSAGNETTVQAGGQAAAEGGDALPASMTEEELMQRPALLERALDIALEQQNLDNIRFLLPLYRRLPEYDATFADYAQAVLHRADGQYAQAERLLRGVLATHPDYAPVRLQLALVLSQSGQTGDAVRELATVRATPDLPPHMHDYLAQFDRYLRREREWKIDANVYYTEERNINRVPEQRRYGNWYFSEPRRSAHGVGYEASVQKTQPLKGHWALRFRASASGKLYWDAHGYDDVTVRAETGAVWRDEKQEVSLMPFYERRWFGTEPYSRQSGGVLRYSRIISPQWQLFGAWQSGYRRYDERDFLEGASHSGTLSLAYRSSPQQFFVLGIGAGYDGAQDDSEAYRHRHARFSWSREWGSLKGLNTAASATVLQRRYRAPDVFNIQRQDTEYATRLTLSHNRLAWRGFTPRLNWTWSRTRGNHFYYRSEQHKVFVDVSKQF